MAEPEYVATARAVYDHSADLYVATIGSELSATWETPVDRAVLAAFAEMVAERSPGPVLDIGCGPGRVTRYLADRGLPVAGVDLSPGMLEAARTAHPDLDFDTGTLTDVPVPDHSLVAAVLWYSIITTPPDDLADVWRELERVVRDDGVVLVAFQAGDGEAVVRPDAYGSPHDLTLYRHDPEAVAASLRAAGFSILSSTIRGPQLTHETTSQALLVGARPGWSAEAGTAAPEPTARDGNDPLEVVRASELRLLDPAVRSDPAALGSMLHADFVEIGASGRIWSRAEIIERLRSSPDPGPLVVEDLTARRVGADTVMVRFTTIADNRRVHRSSWWVGSGRNWQVVFHQGTPATEAGAADERRDEHQRATVSDVDG